MNQVQNQLIKKNLSDSKTSAYCKRNNINEYQFKKALALVSKRYPEHSKKNKSTSLRYSLSLLPSICFVIDVEF